MRNLLKPYLHRSIYFLLLPMLFVIASCDKKDDPVKPDPTQTIADLIDQNDQFSMLDSALQITGLTSTFSGTADYTVFAPTNQAFTAFFDGSDDFDKLSDISVASLTDLLKYHVANGNNLSSSLKDGQSVPTLLSGKNLTIGVSGSTVTVNGISVTDADIEAKNGVIHAIGSLLVPEGFTLEPAAPDQNIAEIATATESLSTLVAALKRFPDLLASASDATATLTVFAPTNDAFSKLLTTLSEALGTPVESLDDVPDYALREVLTYHILSSAKASGDLMATETTLEGSTLAIDTTSGVVINGNTNVVADMANVMATNGVVHVIDAVLLPPLITKSLGTVLQPAIFDAEGRFTTLVTAIKTANLVDALTNPDATLTVFAPTNDAFDSLVAASGLESIDQLLSSDRLAGILQYHVLGTTINSEDIAQGPSSVVPLLEGTKLYISNNDDGIFLNGNAQVIVPDLMTDNGTVHAINAVLIPPTQTVADIAINASQASEPQFTLLVAALQHADDTGGDLITLLQNTDSTYTIFAPTDQAFIDAGFADVAAIEAVDPVVMRNILLYHVVTSGALLSTDLTSGEVATANGTVMVNVGDSIIITDENTASKDATVVTPNVLGTNGVIHIIDQVLLPG